MNLKKVGTFAIAGLFAQAAYSQDKSDKMVNITGSIKAEAAKESSKTSIKDSKEVATFEGFRLARARIAINGSVAAGAASYSLILDPLALGGIASSYGKAAVTEPKTATANDPDGATSSIKEALITHKVNKMFSLKIGRTGVLEGSIENSYSGFDQYFWSYAQWGDPSTLPFYQYLTTGVQADVDFMGNEEHVVRVQVANGMHTAGEKYAKGGMITALQYEGKLMNMIHPIVTYTQYRYTKAKTPSGTAGIDTKYDPTAATLIALGAQLTFSGLSLDVEYDMGSVAKTKLTNGTTDVDGAKAQTYSGIVLQGKYDVKELGLSPWVKVTSETHKFGADQGAGDVSYMLYGLGADYWAVPGKMKYYFAYGSDNLKVAKGDSVSEATPKDLTTTGTKILLGAGARI